MLSCLPSATNLRPMSNSYQSQGPQTVRVSAGTAVKIGFFGALGVMLFSLILSVFAAIIGLVLAAIGFNIADLINP